MIVEKSSRLNQVQEYYFSKKLEQIQSMRNRGIDVVNLGIGSPDLVPPPEALAAASEAVFHEGNHGYASYRSSPELRQAISVWYQKTYNVTLDSNRNVLPLLGSKEGILYLSMALLNAGDEVLIPNPGYPAYASVANLLGANIVEYSLTHQNQWLPDLKQLEAMDLSRCKLMWINYPHMPTGKASSPELFKDLIEFAKRKKIVLCNDNPYGLVLNRTSPLSLLHFDPKFEVSVELNSLSKSFNMAGWRVGMILGASDLIEAVLQVKSNVDSGMFLGVQKAAIEALKVGPAWHVARNAIYEERREIIWQIFDTLKFQYEKDQVGLFVWAKAPSEIHPVTDLLDRILDEAHVFLTPGMIFGSNGNQFARASLCAPMERLHLALSRVKEFCK